MKRTITQLILLVVVLYGAKLRAQQDPQYSQYMFNPLAINPAYSGSRELMNAALVLRRQWVGFDGAPATNVFAINAPTRRGKVGWGMEVMTDKIGPQRRSSFYLNYAYRVRAGRGRFAMGLGAGLVSDRTDWNAIEYKDQNDAFALLPVMNKTVPDFKFGIYFNNKHFFWGASVTHLNEKAYSTVSDTSGTYVARLRRHSYFTIGRAFVISEQVVFSPSIIARSVVGNKITNVDINLNFQVKKVLWLGVSLRSERSIVALVQYNVGEFLRVGYSYDMALGQLRGVQSGSHELLLGFNLDLFKSQTLSPRYF